MALDALYYKIITYICEELRLKHLDHLIILVVENRSCKNCFISKTDARERSKESPSKPKHEQNYVRRSNDDVK
jgi:hypothetical protein